jgi:chaperonin GroES
MSCSFLPSGNRILVQRLKAKAKSSGGILIAESAKEPPAMGVVIATGALVKDLNLSRKAIVRFGKYDGTEVDIDDVKYLLLREDDIEGIIADANLVKKYMEEGA